MKHRSAIVTFFAGALAAAGVALVASSRPHGLAVQVAYAADAPQVGPVGVVDYSKVLRDMGWETKLNSNMQTYRDQLAKEFSQYETRYSQQVGDMQTTLKGLGAKITPQQQQEFSQTVMATRQTLSQLQVRGNEELNQYRNESLRRYKEAISPIVRQIAQQRHMGSVVAMTEGVVYVDPAADLSDAVVDATRKQPPTLTDVPTPHLPAAPQNVGPSMSVAAPTTNATSQPATQPAALQSPPLPIKKP